MATHDLAWLVRYLNEKTEAKLTKPKLEALIQRLGLKAATEFHGEIDRRVKLLVAHLKENPVVQKFEHFEDEVFETETPVDTPPVADQPSTEEQPK